MCVTDGDLFTIRFCGRIWSEAFELDHLLPSGARGDFVEAFALNMISLWNHFDLRLSRVVILRTPSAPLTAANQNGAGGDELLAILFFEKRWFGGAFWGRAAIHLGRPR